MEIFINYQTNNLLTFIGLEKIGLIDLKSKKHLKRKYGYDLGVPVNWSAYEDIAKFFSEDVKKLMVLEYMVIWTTVKELLT
jgi:hypothetical protein